MNPSPNLIEHPHAASIIAARLESLLRLQKFQQTEPDSLRSALIQVAAHFAEIVADRINRAPELHTAAFAELFTQPVRQAEAASAALLFEAVPGSATSGPVVVPVNTPVAPAAGSGQPPLFETQADLEVLRVAAVQAFWVTDKHTCRADATPILSLAGAAPRSILDTAVPIERVLHIGYDTALAAGGLQQIAINVVVDSPKAEAESLEWGYESARGFQPLTVTADTTQGLTASGRVELTPPTRWPRAKVDGQDSCWLAIRTPPGSATRCPPCLRQITLDLVAASPPQPAAQAFHDGIPLDTTKDFSPLGENPRFGTVLQLLCADFGDHGARVDLEVVMTNPVGAGHAPVPPVTRDGDPRLVWEVSTGDGRYLSLAASDGTRSFTQDGVVSFTIPDIAAPVRIGANTAVCVRARLAAGNYRTSAPVVKAIRSKASIVRNRLLPDRLISEGALSVRNIDPQATAPFLLFPTPDVAGDALYLALNGLDTRKPGPRQLTLLVRPNLPEPPLSVGQKQVPETPHWQWQSLERGVWRNIAMVDGSEALTRTGVLKLTVPDLSGRWQGSLLDRKGEHLWLRVLAPQLPRGLNPNAVLAKHLQTHRNEILGSSSGHSGQTFHSLRTPMIGDVALYVREDGVDWIHWEEVVELSNSAATARVFTLDRVTGVIRFGDGRHGRIPPAGGGNIRLSYRSGGGSSGNVPANSIRQLRRTLAGVKSVINPEAAVGGLDPDSGSELGNQASNWLRHRDRAVCAADYADLALRASPGVARAYCQAVGDLATQVATDAGDITEVVGTVNVIVLPHSHEPQPQPTESLLQEVAAYLNGRRMPEAPLVVSGPRYVEVAVTGGFAISMGASPREVADCCLHRLREFLHPIYGGSRGQGWAAGQRPHRSDLFAVLAAVDGVDGVHTLKIHMPVTIAAPFVICAGRLEVRADD